MSLSDNYLIVIAMLSRRLVPCSALGKVTLSVVPVIATPVAVTGVALAT